MAMAASALLREVMHGAVHLLFPRLCEGCRAPLLYEERVLCMSCVFELPQTGFHDKPDNEAALRIAGRIAYRHATAFAYFTVDGLLQHLLHRLKYAGRKSVGSYLGEQFGYALRAAPWIKDVDGIVPVPLHPEKEAKRGFNQSTVIAEGLSQVLGIPVYANALFRTRDTESQTRKSREERIKNMQDAFQLNKEVLQANNHVLLIDDVLTTGATLEAAASAFVALRGLRLSVAAIGLAKD
jgi:ComF family protein